MALDAQFIGVSTAAQHLRRQVERVARTDAKVLITGESGVGKEIVARTVHLLSRRAEHMFVPVNCAALTDSLLESELFGHVKGSFTGAYRDKPGKVGVAHRGTLFLDEVGETSPRMQAALLRFLENGEVQAVGSVAPPPSVNVRVVAATNRNLTEMIGAGAFREDLMYRLGVIHLMVPPLRARREDIPLLVEHFARRSRQGVAFSAAAMQLLVRHRWPGNVRELHNVVEQSLWMAPDDVVEADHLPDSVRAGGDAPTPMCERRRQVADELYDALVHNSYSFWKHVYPLFMARDLTRHDIRMLVRHGLTTTRGNYRALLTLFGIPSEDYKRFLNFLASHDCRLDFREFRYPSGEPPAPPSLPDLLSRMAGAP